MSKLSHLAKNTNYKSIKQLRKPVRVRLNIDGGARPSGYVYSTRIGVETGVYFEICSIKSSFFDGQIVGNSFLYNTDDGRFSALIVRAYQLSNGVYEFSATVSTEYGYNANIPNGWFELNMNLSLSPF